MLLVVSWRYFPAMDINNIRFTFYSIFTTLER